MPCKFKTLDVRPILGSGGDPFQAIMSAVDGLAAGEGLRLIAPFQPKPLYSVMARRGFDHACEEVPGEGYEVRFIPQDASGIRQSDGIISTDDWPEASIELDLSDLAPPEPMVRVLAAVEELKPGQVVFAVLSREPVFLYPELCRRGHQWVGNFDASSAFYRIMIRVGGEACGAHG